MDLLVHLKNCLYILKIGTLDELPNIKQKSRYQMSRHLKITIIAKYLGLDR